MSNFKILGAQRVKALTEMLKEQESAAISEILKEQLSHDNAEKLVNAQLGVQEFVDEIKTLKKRILELSDEIQAKTGYYYSVNKNSNYSPTRNKYTELVEKTKKGDTEKRVTKIKEEFRKKEQRLWLCETLEEAKAIVGIE
jgi:aldehyde:ferredoxin oxidoreductase